MHFTGERDFLNALNGREYPAQRDGSGARCRVLSVNADVFEPTEPDEMVDGFADRFEAKRLADACLDEFENR